jgi:hypothetical protein
VERVGDQMEGVRSYTCKRLFRKGEGGEGGGGRGEGSGEGSKGKGGDHSAGFPSLSSSASMSSSSASSLSASSASSSSVLCSPRTLLPTFSTTSGRVPLAHNRHTNTLRTSRKRGRGAAARAPPSPELGSTQLTAPKERLVRELSARRTELEWLIETPKP